VSVAITVNVEELFKLNDQMLPPIASPQFDDHVYQEQVEAIYNSVYAPALDRLLETRWYTRSGLKALRSNAAVLAEFVAFFRAVSLGAEDPCPPNLLARETRLIWNLLGMCHTVDTSPQQHIISSLNTAEATAQAFETSPSCVKPSENDAPQDDGLNPKTQQPTETVPSTANEFNLTDPTLPPEDTSASIPSARLTALTSLLINIPPPTQQTNPTLLPPPPNPNPTPTAHKPLPYYPLTQQLLARKAAFWSHISAYTSSSSAPASRKSAMNKARRLLDHYENRDVIYTIMRARWLQQRRLGRDRNRDPDRDRRRVDEEEEGGEGAGRDKDEGEGETGKQKRSGGMAGVDSVNVDVYVNEDADVEREWQFCLRVLRNEAGLADGGDGVTSGIGTNIVAMRVAGMGVRALEFS